MKTEPSIPTTIDEYIAGFPSEVQDILRRVRSIVHQAAPEAKEAIKYRMPTFVLNGNLLHFAAYQHHIGFYPTPNGIKEFKLELDNYKNAKGSVQFRLDQPMPYDLIRRITEFLTEQNRQKAKRASKQKA